MPTTTELQGLIKAAANHYKNYIEKNAKESLSHGHEETESDRIEAFVAQMNQITDINTLQTAIINYLNDEKNGKTHPHSFRTMLLHQLLNPDSTVMPSSLELKETSGSFEKQLQQLSPQFSSTRHQGVNVELKKIEPKASATPGNVKAHTDTTTTSTSVMEVKRTPAKNQLDKLNRDVASVVSSFLSSEDRAKMGIGRVLKNKERNEGEGLSVSVNSIFQPHTLLYKLFEHLAGGYYPKAQKILKAHPELLVENVSYTEGTGKDLKEIQITPLQLLHTQLLEHIVNGRQDEAEEILKDHPELLLMRGSVTDPAGRCFENITAFKCALYAKDRHMWDMILRCVPKNDDDPRLINLSEIFPNADKKYTVDSIMAGLSAQYQYVKNKGASYQLDGEKITESHYIFGYDIALMEPGKLDNPDKPLEEGMLYVALVEGNFQYKVKAPNGQWETAIITQDELEKAMDGSSDPIKKDIAAILAKMTKAPLKPDELEKILPAILKITKARHHTHQVLPLRNALAEYVMNESGWDNAQCIKYWCEVVGLAQRYTVAHVRDEYLRLDRSFEPAPKFDEANLPRNSGFKNWITGQLEKWWPGRSGGRTSSVLGRDFGILRYNSVEGGRVPVGRAGAAGVGRVVVDVAAVTALCKVRTEEFKLLDKQLLTLHQPEVEMTHRPGLGA